MNYKCACLMPTLSPDMDEFDVIEFAHPTPRREAPRGQDEFNQILSECARVLNENFSWTDGAWFSKNLIYNIPVSGDDVLPVWNSAGIDYLPDVLRTQLINADEWANYFTILSNGIDIDGDIVELPHVTQRPKQVFGGVGASAADSYLSQQRATELFQAATSNYSTSTAVASALAAVGAYVPAARKGAVTVLVTGAAALVTSLVWWGITSISDLILGESDAIAKLAKQGLSSFAEVRQVGDVRDVPRVVVARGDIDITPIVDGKSATLEKAIKSGEAGVYYMPRSMARQIVEQREPLLVQESRLVPASTVMLTGVGGLVGYAAFGWTGAAIGAAGVYVFSMMNNYS